MNWVLVLIVVTMIVVVYCSMMLAALSYRDVKAEEMTRKDALLAMLWPILLVYIVSTTFLYCLHKYILPVILALFNIKYMKKDVYKKINEALEH